MRYEVSLFMFWGFLESQKRFGACSKKPKVYDHHQPADPPPLSLLALLQTFMSRTDKPFTLIKTEEKKNSLKYSESKYHSTG